MSRSLSVLMAALIAAAGATGVVQAQPAKEAMHERMQNMTPEQRAAAKEKMRQKWESMTPEEREAAKKRFAERRPGAAKRLQEKGQGQSPAAAASAAN